MKRIGLRHRTLALRLSLQTRRVQGLSSKQQSLLTLLNLLKRATGVCFRPYCNYLATFCGRNSLQSASVLWPICFAFSGPSGASACCTRLLSTPTTPTPHSCRAQQSHQLPPQRSFLLGSRTSSCLRHRLRPLSLLTQAPLPPPLLRSLRRTFSPRVIQASARTRPAFKRRSICTFCVDTPRRRLAWCRW